MGNKEQLDVHARLPFLGTKDGFLCTLSFEIIQYNKQAYSVGQIFPEPSVFQGVSFALWEHSHEDEPCFPPSNQTV